MRTTRATPQKKAAHRVPVTDAAIRSAACELFAERGYRATTMDDIAAALGIRGPSLYKHVGSKHQLLAEIMMTSMQALIGLQVSATDAGGSALTQLRRAVEAHVRFHATHRQEAFVGNREIGSLDQPARRGLLELRDTYERGLRAVIERGSAAGEFPVRDPRLVSYAILDMGMGVSAWYRADGDIDVDSLAYSYADLAVRMVTAGGVVGPLAVDSAELPS